MAKYYRRKTREAHTYKRKTQLCWTCSNCYGDCSWSRDFTPIDGWTATATKIKNNGPLGVEIVDSFHITACPQYKKENRH